MAPPPAKASTSSSVDRGQAALGLVLFGWAAVVLFWEPAPLALSFDDAFYYQTIARHLAAGDGFTHDGIQLTNGFHPLWQLALVPLVAATEALGSDASMRATLLVQLALLGGALWLVARRHPRVAPVAAVALLNPYALEAVVGGMESALQVFLIAALVARGELWVEKDRWVRTGLLLGLLALARLEALALVAGYAALVGAKERAFAMRAAAVALVPLLAWGILAWVTFGTVLPVSGLHLSGLPQGGLWMGIGVAWLFAGVTAAYRLRSVPPVGALAFYVGIQLSYVAAFQYRIVPRLWYLAPLLLLLIISAAWLVVAPKVPRALTAAVASLWLLGAGVAWAHRLDPSSYRNYQAARRDGRWLDLRLEPGEAAAGWDIGIVAAHAGGRVANLEGLVAAPGFDPATAGAFLREHDAIRYLVQPIREAHLCDGPPLIYSGVELERLRVARTEAVRFEAVDPRMSATIHRMIFDLRAAEADDVAALRERTCP